MGETYTKSQSKVVTLDRVRIVFEERGAGPPLLMLHGFPGPGIWSRVLPFLSERVRCICPHALGFGASSSQEPTDYRLTSQAEWIRRFLDRAHLERVHVLGHDLGGVVAMALATRYPHRVVRLILSQTPPRKDWVHPMVEMLRAAKPRLGRSRLVAGLLNRSGGPSEQEQRWALFSREIEKLGPEAAPLWKPWLDEQQPADLKALRLALEPLMEDEVEQALRRYQRPTMLLWGCDFPSLSPSWAIQLYHDIPGAKRFELIPFAGHFPQWENPELFARAVLDFVVPKRGVTAGNPQTRERPRGKI